MRSLTFITMGRDAEALREINEALTGSARGRLLAESADPSHFFANVLRLRPSAAIIVLGDTADTDFALIKRLATECPDTAVITAARDASPSLILGSMRSGAREFIQLPIIPDEFHTVLDRVAELSTTGISASKKNGRVVAVFSSKGGSGVSFFAVNLA